MGNSNSTEKYYRYSRILDKLILLVVLVNELSNQLKYVDVIEDNESQSWTNDDNWWSMSHG